MFTLLKSSKLIDLAVIQAPAFLISILIAELFYKFHSFLLECLAFLVTWFVLDWVAQQTRSLWTRNESAPR